MKQNEFRATDLKFNPVSDHDFIQSNPTSTMTSAIRMQGIPATGITVIANPTAAINVKATPKMSRRAERGKLSFEAVRQKCEDKIKKTEAFKSKEDLLATQSETAFVIVSCSTS